MTDRNIRLTLRAFNSECDAAIANTRWNNANAMEKRIENARIQIDRHNASNRIEITTPYLTLPPSFIQPEADSGGWFGRSGWGERWGLARSLASSAAPDPVAG
jgi:hypothetical protein